ncbi:hypothetical protein ERO13_A03G053880v2 [Gossypium hirsutum]|uniref:Membrane-anchored ubiquitin-fold protein 3 n=1 Tax=Gossypium hirsutum TaxID=3635 RepID=A0ABM3AG10_GOSHI|nr:membrane-anchored ubiquitin-fold protein 3-like [Gossypium hirsutum]KAG4207241.1 hypothetical protein ERO13_A03G053880v2 [Gossypium hirsutum]
MPEEDLVDIKFRIYDGSDIGPFRYSATSTVDMLKQRIVSDWPKGKTIVPKSVNEVKLISSGKILENNKTVGLCKVPFGEVPGGAIIMHVVVQPSLAKLNRSSLSLSSHGTILCCSDSLYFFKYSSCLDPMSQTYYLKRGWIRYEERKWNANR